MRESRMWLPQDSPGVGKRIGFNICCLPFFNLFCALRVPCFGRVFLLFLRADCFTDGGFFAGTVWFLILKIQKLYIIYNG